MINKIIIYSYILIGINIICLISRNKNVEVKYEINEIYNEIIIIWNHYYIQEHGNDEIVSINSTCEELISKLNH